MKPLIHFFPILLAATGLVHAQDEVSVAPIAARILGDILDGTPPPSAPPKPEFVIPRQDILDTKTHEQGGRTITIRQIKPIPLPPPPAEPTTATQDEEFGESLAEYREAHP